MKKISRLLSVFLAVIMLCTLASFAEKTTVAADDPVICTIGGSEVRLSDIQMYGYQLYMYGYLSSYTDYASALDYILMFVELPKLKVAEIGAQSILGEEYDAIRAEGESMYEKEIEAFIESNNAGELSEEEYKAKYEEATAYFDSIDYSRDVYVDGFVADRAFFKLVENNVEPISDEEVQKMYEECVEYDKGFFENNVAMYEFYTYEYGYKLFYRPAGYRAVTHILLDADAELLSAYQTAADADAQDAAAKAVVESQQSVIDEIYARLDAGEAFNALIPEYNIDGGMTGDGIKEGYQIHAESTRYVPEFTAGAFSEEMQKIGDVSKPVVSQFGIHIIYYMDDVPAGPLELTEDVFEGLRQNLLDQAQEKLIRTWLDEYEVVYSAEAASYAIQ